MQLFSLKSVFLSWLALLALVGCGAQLQPAPPSRFVLLDGSSKTMADYKGQVLLVNFWATSCTTCVAEMPDIVKTQQKYASRGYDTVAVAMKYDPPAYVVNFAQQRQLPFGVAIDNTGVIARDWGDVAITPTSFLVNKEGVIVKRIVGAIDFAQLHDEIEKLL